MVNNELEFNNSTFSNNSNTFSASVTNNLNDLEVSAQNTNLALASFVSDGNSSNNSSECKASSSENNDSKVANSSLTLEENVSTNNSFSNSFEYSALSSGNAQLTTTDGSLALDDNSLPEENTSSEENTNINCLALTVKKEYNLSIVKHVFVRTWKTTWRVALSVFILNFLTFFF